MDEHVEETHFERALRGELVVKRVMKLGEFFFFTGSDDELLGSESVFDGVAGGSGFALLGAGAGRQLCVGGVGGRMGGGGHWNVLGVKV